MSMTAAVKKTRARREQLVIAVKGMKMPKDCDDNCPIRAMALAYCQQARKSTSHGPGGRPLRVKGRPSFCPLVEVNEIGVQKNGR